MPEPKKKPGRKAIHASPAARAAAYRVRKAEKQASLLAELTARAEAAPTVIEKVVKVRAAAPARTKPGNPDKFAAAVGDGFRKSRRSEQEAQRIKVNTAKAEAAITELMELARNSGRIDIGVELEAMRAAQLTVRLAANALSVEKHHAVTVRSRREAEDRNKLEASVAQALEEIFGADFVKADPVAFAQSILDYEDRREIWAAERGYDSCLIESVTQTGQGYALRVAIKAGDRKRCARVIAEIKVSAPARGHLFDATSGRRVWFAGWSDIEAWWQAWIESR